MDFPGMHAGENPRWKVSASANHLSSNRIRVTRSLQTAACREYDRRESPIPVQRMAQEVTVRRKAEASS